MRGARPPIEAGEPPAPAKLDATHGTGTVKLVYGLYLANLLVPSVGIVGLVVAYAYRADAPLWLRHHHAYQIRTFWLGVLYLIASAAVVGAGAGSFIGLAVGGLMGLLTALWWVLRCVDGLRQAGRREPPSRPYSWTL